MELYELYVWGKFRNITKLYNGSDGMGQPWLLSYNVSDTSRDMKLLCGVRQGGVLTPFLFAIFVDSVVDRVKARTAFRLVRVLKLTAILWLQKITAN